MTKCPPVHGLLFFFYYRHGSVRRIVRDAALFIGDLMCSKAIQECIDDVLAEQKAVQSFLDLMNTHFVDDTDVATKIAYLFSNLVTTSVRWCGLLLQRQAISAVVYRASVCSLPCPWKAQI